MKVRTVLGGCVLLLVACRQPNPEWKGAAEGDATSDPLPTSSETGGGPGPDQTSNPVDSTEGERCNNDNQCPDGWVCGPMGCQRGGAGDPCTGNGDCQAPTGICGPDDVCQAGAAGDPCTTPGHCTDDLECTNDVCGGGSGSSGSSSSSSSGNSSSDGGTGSSGTTGPV